MLIGGLAATAALIAIEITSKGSRHVELAVHEMIAGRYRLQFWLGGVLIGIVAPLVIAIAVIAVDIASPVALAVAGALALIGLFAYEDSFVRAGQSVPLS